MITNDEKNIKIAVHSSLNHESRIKSKQLPDTSSKIRRTIFLGCNLQFGNFVCRNAILNRKRAISACLNFRNLIDVLAVLFSKWVGWNSSHDVCIKLKEKGSNIIQISSIKLDWIDKPIMLTHSPWDQVHYSYQAHENILKSS